MYARVIAPLASLKGLGDLFIDLIWPVDRDIWPVSKEQRESRENQTMERTLEQRVMGEGFDSGVRGKDAWLSLGRNEQVRDWGDDDYEWYESMNQ